MNATAQHSAPSAAQAMAMQMSSVPQADADVENALSALASADLLQGRKAVAIHHNGSTYRLQATRLGKLILTK